MPPGRRWTPCIATTEPDPVRFVHYYPGAREGSGVTVALWAWARALAAEGHEVLVLDEGSAGGSWSTDAFGLGKSDEPATTVREGIVKHSGRGRQTRFPTNLGRHLRQGDILVLHEGWVLRNLVAGDIAHRRGIPYIVMPHGVYAPLWRRYLRGPVSLRLALERRLLRQALAVHIFFAAEAAEVRAIAPTASLITAPTGFEVPTERWAGGGEYVSWLGRIDPNHKGLDLLVSAIGILPPAERPRVVLRGYDYKGGRDRLRRLIAEQGIEAWVDMLDVVVGAEKLEFLRAARAYVHPSRWESQGLALVENLALGVPCIVSSAVAMAADLRQHQAALVVPPTAGDLARTLARLDEIPANLGERGREFVKRELDWRRSTQRFVGALRALGVD